MHRCADDQADVVIDGRAYRLDSTAEAKRLSKISGAKGIEFPRLKFTYTRLEAEHKEELRRKREAAQRGDEI